MRQAVVIIHGIGEQRPMTTLRGFVSSVLNFEKSHYEDDEEALKERTFWTKPDRINDSYELRKISSKGRKDKRSTTHFYEYHWAANMRDTTLRHVLSWFWSLMWTNPAMSHWRIAILWVLLWLGSLFWFFQLYLTALDLIDLFKVGSFDWGSLQWWVIIIPLFLLVFSRIMVDFIGDAARYLKVDVNNIAQREAIRKNGVDLLKALHKSGDYDRIVLVGHSLGSVIAYDIITYLWIDFNKSIRLDIDKDIEEVDEKLKTWGYEFGNLKFGDEDLENLSNLATLLTKDPDNEELRLKMQKTQSNLWLKLKHEKKGWLISDLVTLGSPLTHGNILMADKNQDFLLRKEEREYPTCPPQKDGINYSYENGDGERYLHHATPFAVTRWSNLYFPGDFIGGTVNNLFGNGIEEFKVNYNKNLFWKAISRISPFVHTHYWRSKSTPQDIANKREHEAIKQLYDAMRIADLHHDIYNPISSDKLTPEFKDR